MWQCLWPEDTLHLGRRALKHTAQHGTGCGTPSFSQAIDPSYRGPGWGMSAVASPGCCRWLGWPGRGRCSVTGSRCSCGLLGLLQLALVGRAPAQAAKAEAGLGHAPRAARHCYVGDMHLARLRMVHGSYRLTGLSSRSSSPAAAAVKGCPASTGEYKTILVSAQAETRPVNSDVGCPAYAGYNFQDKVCRREGDRP